MISGSDEGARATLTAKEEALFELLDRHPGRLFSRSEILERVWGLDFGGDDRIVDAYVKRIRRKAGEYVIETVRGAGYRRPGAPTLQQALPHYRHLSGDARMILDLGRRILRVNTTDGVLLEVEAALSAMLRLCGVALLTRPDGAAHNPAVPWLVRGAAGQMGIAWSELPSTIDNQPVYEAAWGGQRQSVALLPLAASEGPWGTLAVIGAADAGWDTSVYAQLEAVAALVNPALRLNMEIDLRRTVEQELRVVNAGLEERVRQRTEQLLRSIQQAELLNSLSSQLEHAGSVSELLKVGLPVLAQLAGYPGCAAWFPQLRGDALATYQADGQPEPPLRLTPDGLLPQGGQTVRCDLNGDELVVHVFGPPVEGTATPEAVALLQTAAQSLALNLSRRLHVIAMERTALTDEYTGLGNRLSFLADLTGEVAYSARHGSAFVMSMVEVSNIRFLNATVGYSGGNDLISRLARLLGHTGRTEDRAYRLNGATFATLIRIPSDQGQQAALLGWQERLRGALAAFVAGAPFPVDVLISDVVCPAQGRSTSDLMRLGLETLRPLSVTPVMERR